MDWVELAAKLRFDDNLPWAEVADATSHAMDVPPEKWAERVRRKLRSHPRYAEYQEKKTEVDPADREEILMAALKKGTRIPELADLTGVSHAEAHEMVGEVFQQGYNVVEHEGELKISTVTVPTVNKFRRDWDGTKTIRFGLVGDTHINSKFVQLTYLHDMYDIFAQREIGDVYHTGDLDEGEEMRPGHKYECYTQGADDHIDEIVRVYPFRPGVKTHFITGNHDASIIKRVGLDIGRAIQRERDDMIYLGRDNALVYLTENCTLELRHPGGGSSYAISYRPQKMVDAMGGDEKPNILALGHYHKAEYLLYRNVHVFQTGTFQSQTSFMRSLALAAMMGGWIVTVDVDSRGYIQRIQPEFLPYYVAIEDDWQRWRKN